MSNVEHHQIGWAISTTHDGFKFDWLVEKMKENKDLVELLNHLERSFLQLADAYVQYNYHPKTVPWIKRAFVVEYTKEPILPHWKNLCRIRWTINTEECIDDSYSTKAYKEKTQPLRWEDCNFYKIKMKTAREVIEGVNPKLTEMFEFVARQKYLLYEDENMKSMVNIIKKCRDGQNYFVDNIYLSEEEKDLVSMCEQCPFDLNEVKNLLQGVQGMRNDYYKLIKDSWM